MNEWARPSSRPLFRCGGKWWTFKSNHPYEERIIELTDDYRDEHGDFIEPELVAWDGISTELGLDGQTDKS